MLRDFAFDLILNAEFEDSESSISYYRSYSDRITARVSLHGEGIVNYVDPDLWGLIVEPKLAYGFQPHGFTLPPQNMGKAFWAHKKLKLAGLQLIILLRFESPGAKSLDHLPRTD